MNIYKYKGKKGINDLQSIYAFHGNSQGDESETNSIEAYKNSGGWLSFVFDCELTDEAIAKESARRKQANEDYIKQLHKEGKFGEEYEISISLMPLSLFDDPRIENKKEPKESYKMVFLNTNKENKK